MSLAVAIERAKLISRTEPRRAAEQLIAAGMGGRRAVKLVLDLRRA